ncbi:hypothetical protein AQUCO_01000167v1 [Aquilegia coerulea]|uniref:Uncharacterized protein n=1 Tax=Aquilegia coerulea TaxID=218851 RepID=A0A2G5E8N2_AQUCA|nr:hypothetical protein AQUCO_01000167v1 [Aquilegia coerulea]
MPESRWFVLIVLLLMETIKFRGSIDALSLHCLQNERQALLGFKQGLRDPSNRLASWVGEDCCKWEGVGCNNTTGHVVKLDLRNPFPFNVFDKTKGYDMPYNRASLHATEVNSSLLELKHLNHLDLSWNNFSGIQIPKFFGSFQQLEYLNLSSALFGGIVPHHLGNLSSLRSLDLSLPVVNYANIPELAVDASHWMSNLFSLQYLDMSQVDFSNMLSGSSLQPIILLPSLSELHLSGCMLRMMPSLFESDQNLTSLVILDLSSNGISGPIPNAIQNMTSLKELDLSYNLFNSSGPIFDEIRNLHQLKILDLTSNQFDGKTIEHFGNSTSPSIGINLEALLLSDNELDGYLPNWLYLLGNLKTLDLSSNSFHGPIPAYFGDFRALRGLDLSGNKLTGSIPTSLGQVSLLEVLNLGANELSGLIPASLVSLSMLRVLNLNDNHFHGQIPMGFGRLSNLRQLDLSDNKLNETVAESLGQLSELTLIDLSNNSLSGVLSEVHFARLSKLEVLYLQMNSFSLNIRHGWIPPFQLTSINLQSCEVGPQFPGWLQTQTQCTTLVLSNASISDSIPNWFQNFSSQLSYLDLSDNKIYGKLPDFLQSSYPDVRLFLSSNRFEGPLPHFPSNVMILDLSKNTITGPIPSNIGDMLPTLDLLVLSDNHINGSIPISLCKMNKLKYLDLSKNKISGTLPQCWSASQILTVIDLASNKLSGTVPSSIGQLSTLGTLRLSNNNFQGSISSALRHCTSLSILDLGDNLLSGMIPTWIGEELTLLRILRLRANNFTGPIPPNLCHLTDLQIMDLGFNNLSGTVPSCVGNWSGMILRQTTEEDDFIIAWTSYADKLEQVIKGREFEYMKILSLLRNLDLSGNNLVGQIPDDLTRLSGLNGLNLSGNHLRGNIPEMIGQMKSLESFDISKNRLSGTIPQSISSLSRLSHLNLSYNNLSGRIPTGSQLQTFDDTSIYIGNQELCGPPLEKKCLGDEPPQSPKNVDNNEEDELQISMFYIGMISGFAVGIWGVFGVLLLKKTWRYAYFRFADDIKDHLLLSITIGIVRLKKKLTFNHVENVTH